MPALSIIKSKIHKKILLETHKYAYIYRTVLCPEIQVLYKKV